MFHREASPESKSKIKNIRHAIYWLDNPLRPEATESFRGVRQADLVIIGAGFTGLWAALEAQIEHPEWSICVLEGHRVAAGASGRNGGFVSASLTHGISNGLTRWPYEIEKLVTLGIQNLNEMEARINEFEIDCDWLRSGELDVAVAPYQYEELKELAEELSRYGFAGTLLSQQEIQDRVSSPLYHGALHDPDVAVVDPARLAWGLAAAAQAMGVSLYENSPVVGLRDHKDIVAVQAREGVINAKRVLLATNAYPPLLKRLKSYVVPVYDYVLMSEQLTPDQRASIKWLNREGIGDSGNQFHYYRMTEDNRILFGGYDAIYHKNSGMSPKYDFDEESFARLAGHFTQTFPQLRDVSFSHGWGGAIDTCSRFSAFWGTAHGGKTAYVAGYTGLGVGASRFGALTCLDLLENRETERTRLSMVKSKPIPFPPEPARSVGIAWTTKALAKADREEGKRNVWLKTLDKLGMGFDS